MAVKTIKYRSLHTTLISTRHDEVRAIRVTDRNFRSVAEWCKGEARWRYEIANPSNETNRRVAVRTPKGIRVARVGDFVVKNEKGEFWVGKDDVFEAQFVKA